MTDVGASGRPVIAYVAGYGRSGSTWLTRLLGQAPGVAAAGELTQLAHDRVAQLATEFVDRMQAVGPECDFANDIAIHYPLQVILAILGLPESDYGTMLRLTQEMFAPDDADFKRDEDAMAGLMQTLFDLFNYFTNRVEEILDSSRSMFTPRSLA